jgi:hypothetical protein
MLFFQTNHLESDMVRTGWVKIRIRGKHPGSGSIIRLETDKQGGRGKLKREIKDCNWGLASFLLSWKRISKGGGAN